jgi:hypothetical protein
MDANCTLVKCRPQPRTLLSLFNMVPGINMVEWGIWRGFYDVQFFRSLLFLGGLHMETTDSSNIDIRFTTHAFKAAYLSSRLTKSRFK